MMNQFDPLHGGQRVGNVVLGPPTGVNPLNTSLHRLVYWGRGRGGVGAHPHYLSRGLCSLLRLCIGLM